LKRGYLQYNDYKLEILDVRLESLDCAKIQEEILSCEYSPYRLIHKRARTEILNRENMYGRHQFASGSNGEVYKMVAPQERTQCEDPDSLVVYQCVSNGENYGHFKDYSIFENHFFRNLSGERNLS